MDLDLRTEEEMRTLFSSALEDGLQVDGRLVREGRVSCEGSRVVERR